jgi:hypothetical protein
MACARCRDLADGERIVSPDVLRKAIDLAFASILEGSLEELKFEGGWTSPTPFAELAAGASWDDIVSYYFRCTACGQHFRLGAETYHGSGGGWEAVEPPSNAAET